MSRPNLPENGIIPKETYIDYCTGYSVGGGWVSKEEEELLKNEYLAPIYEAYIEAIEFAKEMINEEIAEGGDPYVTIDKVIADLKPVMDATRRIGVTNMENIYRTIHDWKNMGPFNEYRDDAIETVVKTIWKVANQE